MAAPTQGTSARVGAAQKCSDEPQRRRPQTTVRFVRRQCVSSDDSALWSVGRVGRMQLTRRSLATWCARMLTGCAARGFGAWPRGDRVWVPRDPCDEA
jgi:hypothetical protein